MRGRTFDRVDDYVALAEKTPAPAEWLSEARRGAIDALREQGFPSGNEAWKFTRVAPLLRQTFEPGVPPKGSVDATGIWGDAPRVVFVDGVLDVAASTVEVTPLVDAAPALQARLGEALGRGGQEGFGALNLALLRGGVALDLDEPGELHLVHVSTGAERLSAVRHLVSVRAGIEATVFEHFVTRGAGGGLTTAATEVFVEPGATLWHARILDEGDEHVHVGAAGAVVGAGGSYRLSSVILGARVARVEATVRLGSDGASTELSGLALLRGEQHADHHVQVDHAEPHGRSDQTFRAVVDDRSRSVYTGAVIVRKGAVGTHSEQLHNALLLSDDAVANTRPWLEIDNDDVSCAHGAAIGSLDEDALFYLRQRGLSELEARALLTWGFARESLSRLPEGSVQDALHERARRWLRGAP